MCPPAGSYDYDENLPEWPDSEFSDQLVARSGPYVHARDGEDLPWGKQRLQRQWRCKAYHEAGHAVMALTFSEDGRTVTRVERIWLYESESGEPAGRCCTRPITPLASAYIALGSIVTEAKHLGVCVDSVIADHQHSKYWGSERKDWLRYQELRKQLAQPRPSREILADIARRLDESWVWAAVGGVAQALLERRCLTGEEVQEIVNAARCSASR
jgi:hypothetical protein